MSNTSPKPLQEVKLLSYDLPDNRIAKHPLAKRDESKLMLYKSGEIEETQFNEITNHLPPNASLFFNNTKVIPARLFFRKETGAIIEVFLLKPVLPSTVMSQVMESKTEVAWECMVGNYKKWKDDQTLSLEIPNGDKPVLLNAKILNRKDVRIHFSWDEADYSFAEIVELAGKVPLPPYLNREAETEDKERYQTVYSEKKGAVAAPTAGLHFTDEVIQNLKQKSIQYTYLTLHVSAGTFQPVKVENPVDHPMHSEQMVVNRSAIEKVIASEKIIPVGTTSMRTLESLYWYGVRLLNDNEVFKIEKLEIYQKEALPSRGDAFQAILNFMNKMKLEQLVGSTEIFIMPGYEFKVCDGLITNFHQPESTLLLLVSAFLKGDWEKVYQYALKNDFRFLSYGDSSLLLP